MEIKYYVNLLNDSVEDITIKDLLKDFINENYNESFCQYIKVLINVFKDVKVNDLSWNLMCNQISSMNQAIKQLIRFYGYLLRANISLGEYTEYLKLNSWILLDDENIEIVNYKNVYIPGSKPMNVIYFNSLKTRRVFNAKIDSEFIRDVIVMFLRYREEKKVYEPHLVSFVNYFEESFGESENIPINLEKFNYSTLRNQFTYYSAKEKKSILLKNLKNFYIFLFEYFQKSNSKYELFNIESGIDRNYLYRANFNELFEEGYRVIYLNKYGDIPPYDKWLLAPNGYERFTTTIKEYEYIPLDFTRVKDGNIRKELKEWFIGSLNSLKTLRCAINNLFKYFELVEGDGFKEINKNIVNLNEYKNKNNKDSLINEYNILLLREYLKQNYDSFNTHSGYISAVRSFCKFLDDKGYYINPIIYDYLRVNNKGSLKTKKITDEDLKIITETLKNNMLHGDVIDKLLWIFIHLLLTTNFRPSEIISLKRNCIQDGMKKGQKVIKTFDVEEKEEENKELNRLKMKRKTSHGSEIEVNPSEYTIRAINEAISITEELLPEAVEGIREFIFIERNKNGNIEGVRLDKFYRRFKKIVGKLDLQDGPYTLYNCRHTFMTKLFEKAVNGDNLYKALIASGHADISTTMKSYVKPDIRDYLEAFYNVKIGDVSLEGEIVDELGEVLSNVPEDLREITVKNGCGYCKQKCDMKSNIDCLICRNFVVVLDRIPYFEKCIEDINTLIGEEDILHEKEHLVSVKRLYVAYLAELYSYKERKENKNE